MQICNCGAAPAASTAPTAPSFANNNQKATLDLIQKEKKIKKRNILNRYSKIW